MDKGSPGGVNGLMWMTYATVVGIFILDLWLPVGIAPGVLYVASILLALWLPSDRSIFSVAFTCTLLTVLGFYFSPPETSVKPGAAA